MGRKGQIRIGTSGYQYDHWKGVFYPPEISKKAWFEYYAQHFDTVEINNTFYQLPKASTFAGWHKRAPKGFLYAVKLNRYLTHIKRLKSPRQPLGKFLKRADKLAERLGPILVQLPPKWGLNLERLEGFLKAAPKRYRWCVEFRDKKWLCPPVYDLLRKHDAALCLHDMIENHPQEITASWVYFRFHGRHYGGSYSAAFLRALAARISAYARRGLDVYVYFNNDIGGYAVRNAQELICFAQEVT